MNLKWEDGFTIDVSVQDNTVTLKANREGLLSLANHLVTIAQDPATGAHLHLDQHNSLEENSAELIIEKTNN